MDKCKYCDNKISENDLVFPTIAKGKYLCCKCAEKLIKNGKK